MGGAHNVVLVGGPGASKTHIATNLGFAEWAVVFGDAKTTTALIVHLTHHCHILKATTASALRTARAKTAKPTQEKTRNLTAI